MLASSHLPRIFRPFFRAKTMTNSIRRPVARPSPPRVGPDFSITQKNESRSKCPILATDSFTHIGPLAVLIPLPFFAKEMPRSSFPRKRESSVLFIPHGVRRERPWPITWDLELGTRSVPSACAELTASRQTSPFAKGRIEEGFVGPLLETNQAHNFPRQLRLVSSIKKKFAVTNNDHES